MSKKFQSLKDNLFQARKLSARDLQRLHGAVSAPTSGTTIDCSTKLTVNGHTDCDTKTDTANDNPA